MSIILKKLEDIRNYLDAEVHPVVSPDRWDVYSALCDMVDDLYEMLEAQDEKCLACGEKTNNAIQALQAELKSQEPQVIALEEACGRDYCFYEYRATGYIEERLRA